MTIYIQNLEVLGLDVLPRLGPAGHLRRSQLKIEKMFPFDVARVNVKMKVDESRIQIDTSVLVGLDVLSAEERQSVLKAIESKESFSPDQPLPKNIQKFAPPDRRTFYLLHATPSYRVIFEIGDRAEIESLDLFLKERLEWFAKKESHR